MQIPEGLMLRKITDTWVVIPTGARLVEFNGIIKLNETGAFLWQKLEQGLATNELVDALMAEYAVNQPTAQADVAEFVSELSEKGLFT